MIPTSKNSGGPAFLAGDCVRSMATDVVEGAYLLIFSFDEENGKPSNVEGLIRARLGELRFVG